MPCGSPGKTAVPSASPCGTRVTAVSETTYRRQCLQLAGGRRRRRRGGGVAGRWRGRLLCISKGVSTLRSPPQYSREFSTCSSRQVFQQQASTAARPAARQHDSVTRQRRHSTRSLVAAPVGLIAAIVQAGAAPCQATSLYHGSRQGAGGRGGRGRGDWLTDGHAEVAGCVKEEGAVIISAHALSGL